MPHIRSLQFELNEQRIALSGQSITEHVVMDFEDSVLHDRDWLLAQPAGTQEIHVKGKGDSGIDELSLAIGEGRNGSTALLVESVDESMGLPGFWMINDIGQGGYIGQANDDTGYILPRGLRANRLEFWLRFEEGFRFEASADPDTYRTLDVGTYFFDPGAMSSRVVESDNWHFYHKVVLRHDQAGDDWIHVVLNEIPQDQRGASPGRPELNPTSQAGNYWELLTRAYFELTPYFSDPETGYPAKMWVDDIKLSYVEPADDIQIQIENFIDGQHVKLDPLATSEFSTTISNTSSAEISGSLLSRTPYQLAPALIDPITRESVAGEMTLAPGESRNVIIQLTPKAGLSNGTSFPAGLLFLPDSEMRPGNHSLADANVEVRNVYGFSGPADAGTYGAFLNPVIGQAENERPTVQGGITFETAINTPLQGVIPAADPNGDQLSYSLLDPAGSGGTLALNSQTGAFTFTPQDGFEGIFRFRYLVNDGSEDSKPAASWIAVGSQVDANRPPIVTDDTVQIWNESAFETLSGNVLSNDRDPNGDSLTVVSVSGSAANVDTIVDGSYGTVTIAPSGVYIYTLDSGHPAVKSLSNGASLVDSFTYTVSDNTSNVTASLSITINSAEDTVNRVPTANDNVVIVIKDDASNPAIGNVLANDSDADGDSLRVVRVNDSATAVGSNIQGSYGMFLLDESGSYRYVLDNSNAVIDALRESEVVVESFEYTISDGNATDTATVTITITGADNGDAPNAASDGGSVTENLTPAVTGNVLLNDRDSHGRSLSVIAVDGLANDVGRSLTTEFGVFRLSQSGSYQYVLNDDLPAVNSLGQGELLSESFVYRISNGNAIDEATLTITILGFDDNLPPSANADQVTMFADRSSLTSGNVLDNDEDAEGETLVIETIADGGKVLGIAFETNYGSLLINRDGAFEYRLDNANSAVNALGESESLTDQISYVVSDGIFTDQSTLTITIFGGQDNRAPIAQSDQVTAREDSVPSIVLGDVLLNDVDPDGDSLSIASIEGGSATAGIAFDTDYGSLLLSRTGSFEYRLDNSNANVERLNDGQLLVEVVTYTVTDGEFIDQATLTIIIYGADDNQAPITADDYASVIEDAEPSTVSGNVLTGDTDPEGEPLVVTAVNGIAARVGISLVGNYGVMRLNVDGSFQYSLDNANPAVDALEDGETRRETFEYTVSDAERESTADLIITIEGRRDHNSPIAVDDEAGITEDSETDVVSGNVLANDVDPDGEGLTVVRIDGSSAPIGIAMISRYGLLKLDADGSFDYTLNSSIRSVDELDEDEFITESFRYTVFNGYLYSDATLSITIFGSYDNAAPIANADQIEIAIDELPIAAINGNVMRDDADPDGDAISLTAVNGFESRVGISLISDYGVIRFNTDGSFVYQVDETNPSVSDPNRTYTLSESFDYTISDGKLSSSTALSIAILPLPNRAPIALDDPAYFIEDEVEVIAGNLLANDRDSDGDPIFASSMNGIPIQDDTLIHGAYGALRLSSDGSYTYALDQTLPSVNDLNDGDVVTEVFTYTLSDGNLSDSAQLTVTIEGTTDVIVAGDSNLDGVFDSTDLILALQSGEYEDFEEDNSSFTEGDWNGDQEFDSLDFVHAFTESEYEADREPLQANAVDRAFMA